MTLQRPKILIIFAKRAAETSTRFGGFARRIKKNGGFAYADVDHVALEDLLFHIIDHETADVYDESRNIHLKDYDFVYFKSWQSMPALAASAALYLEGMGIAYADVQARHEFRVKTTNQMAMWASGVSVPETIWGSKQVLLRYAKGDVIYPLIIKAVDGEKGNDNHLARTSEEATAILEDSQHDMVIQEFIPNDGDYRIGVYGHGARWAIYRKSGGVSHLNNTSAGGTAILLDINDVSSEIKQLAEAAADACDLAISGVDVVAHAKTGKLYVFEANQGSQIVTGAYSDTNMAAFSEGMHELVARRRKPVASQRKAVIGRRVSVAVDGAESPMHFVAKVDTGAYRSAIDATNIELHIDDAGEKYLTYTLQSRHSDEASQRFTTYDFGKTGVQSSLGDTEMRYVVPMTFTILGKTYSTRVTLANRSKQKCQVLIGRTLLAGNFLVNVEYSTNKETA